MNPISGREYVAKFFAKFEDHFPAEAGKGLNFFFSDELTFGVSGHLWNSSFSEEFKKRKYARGSYVVSPFALIDLIAILPFFLQAFIPVDLRALRFLRLLRILKLFRILIPAVKEFAELNRGRTFRQKIHALVFPSEYGGKLHNFFDNLLRLLERMID